MLAACWLVAERLLLPQVLGCPLVLAGIAVVRAAERCLPAPHVDSVPVG